MLNHFPLLSDAFYLWCCQGFWSAAKSEHIPGIKNVIQSATISGKNFLQLTTIHNFCWHFPLKYWGGGRGKDVKLSTLFPSADSLNLFDGKLINVLLQKCFHNFALFFMEHNLMEKSTTTDNVNNKTTSLAFFIKFNLSPQVKLIATGTELKTDLQIIVTFSWLKSGRNIESKSSISSKIKINVCSDKRFPQMQISTSKFTDKWVWCYLMRTLTHTQIMPCPHYVCQKYATPWCINFFWVLRKWSWLDAWTFLRYLERHFF